MWLRLPNALLDFLFSFRQKNVQLKLGVLAMLVFMVVQWWHDPSVYKNNLLNRLDAVIYDVRFQLLPPTRSAAVPIVIVDIDEASLQAEGRWPWSRSKVAQLVQQLQQQKVALVAFDVVFAEAESNPAQQLLQHAELSAAATQELQQLIPHFDADQQLSQALGYNTILGYFFHTDGYSTGYLPPPVVELDETAAAQLWLNSMPHYTANLENLGQAALANGFVVAVPDGDGVIRRLPLLMRYQNGVYASLSLEVARLALGAPWIRLEQSAQGAHTVISGLHIGKQLYVPLDESGSMLVPYKGKARSFITLSATQLLQQPQLYSKVLDGALVLIGTSALGLGDLRTTPLQTAYPGVEAHANVIDALIQAALASAASNDPSTIQPGLYYQPDWAAGANFMLLLVLGVLLAFALPQRPPWVMVFIAGGCLLTVIAINFWLWHRWHMALPMALQLSLVLVLTTINMVGGYLLATRQKHSIQQLFGAYVPADHVQRLLNQPDALSLEGEQREMTVLFADIRQFTAMSEGLSAAELKHVLNRYLSAITEVIFQHKGTIDKYVGDMVMAFWNAPVDEAKHAQLAVKAALAMQQRMQQLRTEFAAEQLPAFYIGIGLNTGLMNVGDMGSSYRRAYTVLGDAVNLASRLEGLTAYYQVPILLSETTRAQAPQFSYRTIDKVRVKGRQQALYISQPLDPQQLEQADHAQTLALYQQALENYFTQQWETALMQFQQLQQHSPQEKIYTLYIERIYQQQHSATPTQWDGVFEHAHK